MQLIRLVQLLLLSAGCCSRSWEGVGNGVRSLALPRLQQDFESVSSGNRKREPQLPAWVRWKPPPLWVRPEQTFLRAPLGPPGVKPSGGFLQSVHISLSFSYSGQLENLHPGDTSLHSPPEMLSRASKEEVHPPFSLPQDGTCPALLALCANLVPSYDSCFPDWWFLKTQNGKY